MNNDGIYLQHKKQKAIYQSCWRKLKLDSINKDEINQCKKQQVIYQSFRRKQKLDSMNKDKINQSKRKQASNKAARRDLIKKVDVAIGLIDKEEN